MKRIAFAESRRAVALGAVLLFGLLALMQQWLSDHRPRAPESRADREIVVTSGADQGEGSLREAIFTAAVAGERARIRIGVARVVVMSPLPPLSNPHGVVIEGDGEATAIDASGLKSGPLFVVDAPDSSIRALAIRGAPEQAILVRASRFQLWGATLANCDEGVHVVDGVGEAVIERSVFAGNRIGVQIASAEPGLALRQNRFSKHRDAALWAVRANEPAEGAARVLQVSGNRFDEDRIGAVLGNVPALVEDNELVGASEAALYLIGRGAVARGNRIRGGAIGVVADNTQGAVIEANELDHNRTMGVLVRSSRGASISRNRIHANGYGIAFVLGGVAGRNSASDNLLLAQQFDALVAIGDSPLLRQNSAQGNRGAAVRMLDFFPAQGRKVAAAPFLDQNALHGNGFDEPVRGEYRVREAAR